MVPVSIYWCHKLATRSKEFQDVPPLGAIGLLTTYWQTLSSLVRLKSLRILLALLGPSLRGTVVSVRPGISPAPENTCKEMLL